MITEDYLAKVNERRARYNKPALTLTQINSINRRDYANRSGPDLMDFFVGYLIIDALIGEPAAAAVAPTIVPDVEPEIQTSREDVYDGGDDDDDSD